MSEAGGRLPRRDGVAAAPSGALSEQLGTASEAGGRLRRRDGVAAAPSGALSEQLGTASEAGGRLPRRDGVAAAPSGALSEQFGTVSEAGGYLPRRGGVEDAVAAAPSGALSEQFGTASEAGGYLPRRDGVEDAVAAAPSGALSEQFGTVSEQFGTVSEHFGPPSEQFGTASVAPQEVAVLVVMGVSGAGKTTVARTLAGRLGWEFADGDSFHPQANVDKMAAGHALTDEDRWPWLAAIAAWIRERADSSGHGIVACSALKRSYRDVLRGPGVVFVNLTGDRETIAERIRARHGHFMPASLLDSQLADLQPPGPDERAVTVDVAGTPSAIADRVLTELRALPAER